MKHTHTEQLVCEKDRLVIDLGANQTIAAIQVFNKNNTRAELCIQYAQNNITSDLIDIAVNPKVNGGIHMYDLGSPICASQIVVLAEESVLQGLTVELHTSDSAILDCYPHSFDFDLKENRLLEQLSVLTEGHGVADFDVYTSLDGRDFYLLEEKKGVPVGTSCSIAGKAREARIVRVYLKYASEHAGCAVIDVLADGQPSKTPVKERPEIKIPTFERSEYNVELTEKDTYAALYGIIERRIGAAYRDWFSFSLAQSATGYDFFELSDLDGKIAIKGNSGVSMAAGLHYYLKYYCRVHLSQVGDQVAMPSAPVALGASVHKETKAKIRYAYNYCTLSYTMAFWGEEEWQRELDWLALNGVNLILDTTAQEEVWRRFLGKLGYAHEDIKSFLVGPAYYAWAYMANTTKIGGPLHDSWFERRTELARKNHLTMKKLGMCPILQGFGGMMPLDIKKYDPDIDIIEQGLWCASIRPPMIRTTADCYKKYAALFYQCQREVYGNDSPYYATDPFHEGGKVGDMQQREISRQILSEMLREREDAVWVVQSWQKNPSSEFLAGAGELPNGKEHLLVLDLYAEKSPNHLDGKPQNPDHGYDKEFDGSPWIFCMLNNFGGRLGLHGHLDNLVHNIPLAMNTASKLRGVGITPEASENNPVLYDFLFDCIWQDSADESLPEVDMDAWLREYALRRYGAESENTAKAWLLLKDSVYRAECNMLGQGATESIVNARPAFDIKAASSWGNAIVGYDKALLEKALELLEADYESLKHCECYLYDLTSLRLQVLSNKASEYPIQFKQKFEEKDLDGFKTIADDFLRLAYKMDEVASQNRYYTLDRFLEMANKLAEDTDDLTRYLYPFNAKSQITTWGEYSRAEIGRLHDYSNRTWSGLIRDFYIPRWERWLTARINELEGKPFEASINWYDMEWHWVTAKA